MGIGQNARVFLSHSTQDRDIVERVLSYLESHGQHCWIAPRDIPPGADWAESIIDGIDSASWMVLILSEHSNRSPQVRREVERAVSKGVTIIPLMIEKFELSKWMHFYISAHQRCDVTELPLEEKLPDLLEVLFIKIDEKQDSSDLSDLSSLLEEDLDRLSLALDNGSDETKRLLIGERRWVTVLNIRTELSDSELSNSARNTISKTIENLVIRFLKSYGGYLDEKDRGCYCCVLGLERVLEDDNYRAVSCGIHLFNGFGELNSVLRSKGFSVNFGLGIASGMLEVVQTGTDHPESRGEVLAVAEELSYLASNEVLVSSGVHKNVKGQFRWEQYSEGVHRIADYSLTDPETKVLSIRSPFVGRKEELAQLNSLLERQQHGINKNRRGGSKHLVMGIKGEAGIGKSRLVHEFIESSIKENEEILELRGQTLSFAQPSYWLWTTLLRNLLDIEFGTNLDYYEFKERLTNLSDDEDLINSAPFLSELLSIKSYDRRLEEFDGKTIAMKTRIAFRNLLKSLSTDKCLVVVLEDLHWLDLTDRTVLEFIVGNCDTDRSIVFLLLYRPEGEDGNSVEFDIHSNYAEVEEIKVVEVDEETSSKLIEELFNEISESCKIEMQVKNFILNHSRGNPFYLEELVLNLVESDILAEHYGEWSFQRPLEKVFVPDSLTGLLHSRLDRLPETWRNVLQNSSVLGIEFQLKLYRKLSNKLQLGELRSETFDGLERKQMLLSEVSAFEKKYVFRHMLVHDTAYSSILIENLPKLHKAAAESIEEMFEGEKEQVSSILTYHWEKAGDMPRAIAWGMKALEHAVKSYSNEDALELSEKLEGWLEDMPDGDENTEVLFGVLSSQEKVLNLLGRREEQELTIDRMIVIAEKRGSAEWMADSYRKIGNLVRITGCMDKARAHYEKALEIHREVGNRRFEGIVLASLGILNREQDRMDEALTLYEKALEIHREVGDHRNEGIVLGSLGILHRGQGRMDEARAHFEKALEIHREVGNRRSEGIVIGSLGMLHRGQGRMDEARAHYEKALEIHREVGDRRSEGSVLASLGILHQEQGHMDEARAHYEKALEIHREVGNHRSEGRVLGSLGLLHHEQGRMNEARAHYEKALEIHREVGDHRAEGRVLGNLGVLYHKQGRMDKARTHFEKALEIHREVGNRRDEGIVLGSLGLLHHEQGRMNEAHAHYEKALEIHREIGNRRSEGDVLIDLGLLDFEEDHVETALEDYRQSYKIISEIKPGKADFEEDLIELRQKLISAGYSENEVPWPSHWAMPGKSNANEKKS